MSSPLSRAPPWACSPLQTASISEDERPEGPAWGEYEGGGVTCHCTPACLHRAPHPWTVSFPSAASSSHSFFF